LRLPRLFLGGALLGLGGGVIAGAAVRGGAEVSGNQPAPAVHPRGAAAPFLIGKLREAHPQLSRRDAELVLRGLRQFFMAHLRSDRKFVAMPSKVVDTAWHEFILHTQGYQNWCKAAFGGMLHHSPAEVLGRTRSATTACAAPGTGPARKRASIRASRRGCRCCSRWTSSSRLRAASVRARLPRGRAAHRLDAQCGTSFGESSSDGGSSGDAGGFGGSESSSRRRR
jgi:hypothetical protein